MQAQKFAQEKYWSEYVSLRQVNGHDPVPSGYDGVNHMGDPFRWGPRIDLYNKTGQWPEEWGPIADVPEKYHPQFSRPTKS